MAEHEKLLCEVDFLPASYHEEGLKRRAKLWQLLVIAGFGGILIATELGHRRHEQRVQNDLAAVDGRYAAAEVRSRRLATLQLQLAAAQAKADLLTFLRHRWPTSQIVAAIVQTVPESVTFTSLEMSREILHQPQPSSAGTPGAKDANKDANADKLPAASRDLKQLRAQTEGCQTVVTLSGTMTDPAELHSYLETLAHNRLFTKVALNSIASPGADGEAARFSARLIVRPGYGEPGGPPMPTAASAAASVSVADASSPPSAKP
jgi:Tfp pilus assembly protein PilN